MPDVEATAWTAARSLLERPGARGRAIADTGLFTAAPPELAQHVQHPLSGRSPLDGIETADRTAVAEAWERTQATGTASVVVRLTEAGRPCVRLTLLDLRDTFGVYLGVTVPEHDEHQAATAPVGPAGARPPSARVRRDSLAVLSDVDDATCRLLGRSRQGLGGRGPLELLDDPAHACASAQVLDASDEMAAHEAVRAAAQLLHRLAEMLPVGVAQLSADGDVVYASSRLADLLGLVPRTVADLGAAVADADRARAGSALRGVLGGGEGAEVEVEVARDGPRSCVLAVRRLDDGAGRTTGAVVCLTDLTDLPRLPPPVHLPPQG